ncbi:MAG: DsbA family protein [Candidatus Niyogibacteria bacterium]|nr:MAG: DsbA family protein [Candidatus Niyogibacteria bacterium]
MNLEVKSKYLIPVSVIIAGAIIALAVVYVGGPKKEQAGFESKKEQAAVAGLSDDAQTLLKIQEDDFVLGNPSAPVVFVEFGDFQCPFCGRFWSQTLPQIKEKYVKAGQVVFVWRDFAFLGQESYDAAVAARCAGEQGKFWEYHDALFGNQQGENRGAFSDANLKSFAANLGLESQKFNECLDSEKYLSAVQDESALGRQLGVSGTPSSFINGRHITGALPLSSFEAVIQEELAGN